MNAEQKEIIEQLYLEMYDLLLSYARSSLETDALAEEAVQDTFQIACIKPEKLCRSPNPKGWLLNTLKNVISNTKRARDNANWLLTDFLSAQSSARAVSEDTIQLELIYEDWADSDAFQLIKEMAIDGKSILEMAQKRGISLDACKKRIQRAKEVLRKKIRF